MAGAPDVSKDTFTLKNDLIGKVQDGELTPDEAEQEAARLGCGPLASTPPASAYDPMRCPAWTLPMAVAWIAWRSLDDVREAWDRYREECWDWHFRRWRIGFEGSVTEGHFLEQRSNPTLSLLQLGEILKEPCDEAARGRQWKPVKQAVLELRSLLAAGTLTARAVDAHTLERVDLSEKAWRDFELIEQDHRDMLIEHRWHRGSRCYRDITVANVKVRELWPAEINCEEARVAALSPDGIGYMPLYSAARWIATQGEPAAPEPEAEAWRAAYDDLLERISASDVEVVGSAEGLKERLDGFKFAGCKIGYPFDAAPDCPQLDNDLVLVSRPYVDDECWSSGCDDSLRNRLGTRWSKLMVRKQDVASIWPFGLTADDRDGPAYRTGAPGRPTPICLVRQEFDARYQRGKTLETLMEECKLLSEHLAKNYPHVPHLKPKTIANNLRHSFNERKNRPKL